MKKNYCTDPTKIENYEKAKADNFVGWCIHHRFETKCPVFKPSVKDLKNWGLYYNRPPEELIYLTFSEHQKLHIKSNSGAGGAQKGVKKSNIAKKRIGDANRRKAEDPAYRQKLSDSWSNRDNTERCKKISDKMKGNHNVSGLKWYNNGFINKRAKECPEGFVAGRI